jgi:hypothetical protein
LGRRLPDAAQRVLDGFRGIQHKIMLCCSAAWREWQSAAKELNVPKLCPVRSGASAERRKLKKFGKYAALYRDAATSQTPGRF